MRADARRNVEKLLVSAHEAFEEHGSETSLEDIAKRAGVGIGTLYRHFPTRQALLEALLRERMEGLRALGDELLETEPPRAALADWLKAVVAHSTTYGGLAASLMVQLLDEDTELAASCCSMRGAGQRLLTRAQEANEVRADVAAADLLVLANGIAWAAEGAACGTVQVDRLLSIVTHGLTV